MEIEIWKLRNYLKMNLKLHWKWYGRYFVNMKLNYPEGGKEAF